MIFSDGHPLRLCLASRPMKIHDFYKRTLAPPAKIIFAAAISIFADVIHTCLQKCYRRKKKATTPTHRRPPLFGRAIVAPPPELGGRGRGRVGEPHHHRRRRPRRGHATASMTTRKTTTSSTSKVRPRLTITGFIVPMRRGRRIRRTHASPSPDLPSLTSAVVGYTTPVRRCCQIPPPPPSNHAPQPRSATAAPFPTTAASSTLSESEGEEMRREGVGT